ncbi:MAG: hypothetical protein KBC33_02030 [Candidatus Pacebacteria bacterium]|nr:hypothetical protein [Candidatus Paceibacterota bacterium]
MVYIYWTVAGIIALFVVFGIRDTINRTKARNLLPQILPRDWIDGRDLRKFLKVHGVSLSSVSFYSMMSNADAIVEMRTVPRIIDRERVSIRQYRRKFGVPITPASIGLARGR